MDSIQIFIPNNNNLRHASDSFAEALKPEDDSVNHKLEKLGRINGRETITLIKKVIKLKEKETISLFFFSIQLDYLFLVIVLKLVPSKFSNNLRIYYLMHEPRYESGRINPIKANLVYLYNLLFGNLADRILLPSDEALEKANTFLDYRKLDRVNLSFISIPDRVLQKNLIELKGNWEQTKTFSLLGTSAPDKNPQGFTLLANITNRHYSEKTRFIRAGRDLDILVEYDEEIVVRFPGYMTNSTKKFLFGITHFVVVPYLFSTQSGVIIEALSHGKLLIVNDIPAFAYLKGLDFVFIIDFKDEKSLVDCLEYLFSMDSLEYENRFRKALQYFEDNFSEIYLARVMKKIVSNPN
jgi:hypothetical protein